MNLVSLSRLPKDRRVDLLAKNYSFSQEMKEILFDSYYRNNEVQNIIDSLSENTIGNFHLPYGIVPNVLLNGELLHVPIVTEESSVVAAASKAAKFWTPNGGIKTIIHGEKKIGTIYFSLSQYDTNSKTQLADFFNTKKDSLIAFLKEKDNFKKMVKRGGGPVEIKLDEIDSNCFRILIEFLTGDAMGANYINSSLEMLSVHLKDEFYKFVNRNQISNSSSIVTLEILMAILSNYTPDCVVEAFVETEIDSFKELYSKEFYTHINMTPDKFATKFKKAVDIASIDKYRAVTHNKGIFNGVDGVLLATGNDFRAVDAAAHACAVQGDKYVSLSNCELSLNSSKRFLFKLKMPMAVGTIGGITKIHPLARLSFLLLNISADNKASGNVSSASKLMSVCAAIGLLQNFGAVTSLVTIGIQQGHMRMHLTNIFNQLNAKEEERILITKSLDNNKNIAISYSEIDKLLAKIRKG